MATPTTYEIDEQNCGQYTCTLVKEDGSTPIADSQLTTLTLTLYSARSGAIVNGRDGQNVLNTNNVTVNASGVLIWDIAQADTAVLDPTLPEEIHVALFRYTYQSGTRGGNHEVRLRIRNLHLVN